MMQVEDFKWFLDNYDSLFNQYGDCYLVIKNKSIIGKFDSYASGVNETAKSEPLGTFIVQHCNGNETGYTNYISTIGLIV